MKIAVLRPFNPVEAISTTEAARRAGVSDRTIRNWCLDHGIGRKVGGHHRVSLPALDMLVESDTGALADYQAGIRGARVRTYFDRHNIPLASVSAFSDFADAD